MKSRTITYKKQTMSIKAWAKKTGIKETTITDRIYRGWSIKETLHPYFHHKKKYTRLNPDQIIEIKKLYIQGYTCSEIGKMYSKDPTTITHHTKNIRHIPKQIPPHRQKEYKNNIKNQPGGTIKTIKKIRVKKYKDYLIENKKRNKINAKKEEKKDVVF